MHTLTDVGVIRSLLAAKQIDEINEIIHGWGPSLMSRKF